MPSQTAQPPGSPTVRIERCAFSALPGWDDDDQRLTFQALRRSAVRVASHPPKSRSIDSDALSAVLAEALALPDELSVEQARQFFEAAFQPYEIDAGDSSGFFTGYYEPVVAGSRTRTERFTEPLYGVPDDLFEFDPDQPPPGIDPTLRFARRTASGATPYFDRGQIQSGALTGQGLELAYLESPVDAFFIHIQGSARIDFTDGSAVRLTYAAKSGHPYTAIGRVLIDMGELEPGKAAMKDIRTWLAENSDRAATVMAKNRSFIFFRETTLGERTLGPVAAAKVQLTPGRSLAVDRLLHTFHAPVWIDTQLPDGRAFRQLMVAQDTGSAIVGPARGDIFFGSGDAAGKIAGGMSAKGRFILLAPRQGLAPELPLP